MPHKVAINKCIKFDIDKRQLLLILIELLLTSAEIRLFTQIKEEIHVVPSALQEGGQGT